MANIVRNTSDDSEKIKGIQYAYIVSVVTITAIIVWSFICCVTNNIDALSPSYNRDVTIDIMAMILCGILIYSLAQDKPWDIQNRSLFRLIFTLCVIFHFDMISSFLEGNPEYITRIIAVNTVLLFTETLLIYSFWAYVRVELNLDDKAASIANTVCLIALAADFVIDLINLKTGFIFTVNSAGKYVSEANEGVSQLTTLLIYSVIWVAIIMAKGKTVKEKLILLTFQVFPLVANILGFAFDNYSAVFPTYLFAVMLIYINVFAVRGKRILEQEALLNKQRATLMVSQIQPHFLYNVLTTISNLCTTDPEEAEETTVLFSQYLRTNLDSLRREEPVPFGSELGHINTYVELEKKRFKDKLNVEIDCPERNFLVPSLGLQPIVENSIKHGIRGKETPGHLWITSRKTDGGYEVVIKDDGVGFDMNAPLPDDGRSHVGMVNVKSRLEQMCDAKVVVESNPGNGCTTTVFFPEG